MNPVVKKNLASHGFAELNEMQKEVIASCREVSVSLVLSPTGSGKTIAFMVPAAETVLSLKTRTCACVILSPTRELALQNAKVGKMLLEDSGAASCALYGQMTKKRFSDVLSKPPALLSSTPGKLLEALRLYPEFLKDTRFFIIDEFDRLFDMGFEKDVDRILHSVAPKHTLLASASFEQEAKTFIENHFRGQMHFYNFLDKRKPQIEKIYKSVPSEKLHFFIRDFIVDRKLGRVVIFCPKISDCQHLCHELSLDGFRPALLTSVQTQKQRIDALEDFKAGKNSILIATDIMARGIDIGGIEAVISTGNQKEDTLHRAGRTARYGQRGIFLSLSLETAAQNSKKIKAKPATHSAETLEDIDIETFE